jgi:hypothetical protein
MGASYGYSCLIGEGLTLPPRINVILTSYRWRLQWQISKYAYKVHGIWGELFI